MNFIRACRHCTGFAITWSLTVALVLVLLVTGILIRLYYKPFNLDAYMPTVHQMLHVENVGGIQFDNLALSFDGRFNFQGRGVLIVGPNQEYLATGRRLRLELSMLSLLKGHLAFNLLEIDGLGVRVENEGEAWQIGEYTLAQKRANKAPLNKGAFFKKFLQQLRHNQVFKYLEVVNLNDAMVHMTVAETVAETGEAHQWTMSNTDFLFTRHKVQGLHGEITGLLKRGEDATSFMATVEQPEDAPSLRMVARFGDIQSRFFSPLLPKNVRDNVNAFVENLNLSARLDSNLTLSKVRLDARLGVTEILMPDLYPNGVFLRAANLGFSYFPARPNGTKNGTKIAPTATPQVLTSPVEKSQAQLKINDFVIEDHQGLIVSGQGEVLMPTHRKALLANTLFRAESAKLHDVMTYLPAEHTKDVTDWLKKSTNYQQAILEDVTLNMTGNMRNFSFGKGQKEGDDGRLKAQFNFKNLDVDLYPKLPRIKNTKGRAVIEGDDAHILSPTGGMMNQQRLSDIDVLISNIYSQNGEASLRGKGTVAGAAQGTLPLIAQLSDAKPILKGIEGKQKSEVDLVFPLGGDEEDVQFVVNTKVTDPVFTLPHIDKQFTADGMTVETTDKQLTVKSAGHVAFHGDGHQPWPVKLMWQENMKNLGAETYVEADLTTTDTPLPDIFSTLHTDIKGDINHHLTLERNTENPAWFNLTLTSDLTPATISVRSFDWQKPAQTKGKFKASGRLNKNGQIFDAEMLLFDAPQAEILGAAHVSLDAQRDIQDYTLNLSPFKLGKTNANIVIQDELFRLTGEQFNFAGIGQGLLHEDITLADGSYQFDLKKLVFKGGKFFNIKGEVVRNNNTWQTAQLNAKVGEGRKDFSLLLADAVSNKNQTQTPPPSPTEKTSKPIKHLEFYSGDAGASLRSLGIYENLYDGEMEVFLKISKEYSPLGFDAQGHMLIENAFVRKAPAMMRLISLISLEQIMSADRGIAFEEMKLPLEVQNRKLYIHDGKMTGPNIAVKLDGNVDFAQSQMNIDGALTPASGINSVIGHIPILGAILTGTQGAMMVADFGIEGDIDKPDVWANPLSLVTPGLLKDIFGGIFGGQARSEAPSAKNSKVNSANDGMLEE